MKSWELCDTYQKPIPEYMQEALIEVIRSDIEEGNFCDALLGKLIDQHLLFLLFRIMTIAK